MSFDEWLFCENETIEVHFEKETFHFVDYRSEKYLVFCALLCGCHFGRWDYCSSKWNLEFRCSISCTTGILVFVWNVLFRLCVFRSTHRVYSQGLSWRLSSFYPSENTPHLACPARNKYKRFCGIWGSFNNFNVCMGKIVTSSLRSLKESVQAAMTHSNTIQIRPSPIPAASTMNIPAICSKFSCSPVASVSVSATWKQSAFVSKCSCAKKELRGEARADYSVPSAFSSSFQCFIWTFKRPVNQMMPNTKLRTKRNCRKWPEHETCMKAKSCEAKSEL